MTSEQRDETRASANRTTRRGSDRTQDKGTVRSAFGRRRFLRAASGVAVGGLLAGCTGAGDDGSDGGGTEPTGGGSESVDDWLSDTGNYDSVTDLTGETTVTVEVGAKGNNGSNAFAPAAVAISPGTTVVWTWVSGYHNVVGTDGEVDSGRPEQNASFEYTFEAPKTVRYYCEPHESVGMKGAVVVSEGGDESLERGSDDSR